MRGNVVVPSICSEGLIVTFILTDCIYERCSLHNVHLIRDQIQTVLNLIASCSEVARRFARLLLEPLIVAVFPRRVGMYNSFLFFI